MKRSEIISIVDPVEFGKLLVACKLPDREKAKIIRERWEILYQTYRPDEKHIAGLRDYHKHRRTA